MLHRRQFLIASMGAAAGLAGVSTALAAAPARRLALANLRTGEAFAEIYWANGRHIPSACRRIDRLLRDHRTGEIVPISTRLLDLLHALRGRLGTEAPFEIVSAYRSPETNAALARKNAGVARKSLHMQGMAIDLRVAGCPLRRLRAEAAALKAGGVGYYPKSGFIHLDVGPVRYW